MNETPAAPTTPASLVVLCALVPALGAWLVLIIWSFVRAGGLFEYPLDDVYIHLAMAEQIRAGGYGVNAGEYTSAASSPIYPFLLAPLTGGDFARMVPFAVNLIALVANLLVWARIVIKALEDDVAPRWVMLALAAAMPLALNFAGLAFNGMEHGLHVFAVLLIVAGLQTLVRSDRISALLVIGIALSPLVRLEGVALSLAAAGVVFVAGRRGLGLGLAVLAVGPVAGFMYWLTTLGLSPLPNSVMAKLGDGAGGHAGFVQGLADSFVTNTSKTGGLALLGFSILAILGASVQNDLRKWVLLAVGAAAFAHLMAGQIGWMDRYEIYALVMVIAAVAFARRLALPALVAVVAAGVYYVPQIYAYHYNPRAIHLQHSQMARFAQTFANVPVAVNDLGRVAWRNPNYVLDLWGLANDEARALRLGDTPNGWAGRLADERGVKLAMIYDNWLDEAVPEGWVRLGTLRMLRPAGFLGSDKVAFYATDPAATEQLREAIALFQTVLPEDAVFEEAVQ
ncbi:hypothetical protein [Nereida sp. MMG025]|uniref:hypothetical protein n=1 Tax=Nereida sp. MMG025 TaxID=2909981 RepID=UPI001F17489B|nr:hypothetical protein [Nereida sp. MMG025]MCF6443915.1 hypothetical protein [Nereida sp. MMG025]